MAEPIRPRVCYPRGDADAQIAEIYSRDNRHLSPIIPMQVHLPTEIAADSFVGRARDRGKVCRHVVLKTVFADVAKKTLKLRNFDDARTAKGVERIVSECAFADISTHDSSRVVGGEARKTHSARLHAPDTGSESVFLPDRPGDDLLEIHADILKKMLRKIAAMKAHCLVGIVSIVVVPVEQTARSLRSEPQSVHAYGAANCDFAGARDQVVAHHAHDGAGHNAEVFFHRRPALHGAYFHVGLFHPTVNDSAELGH